MGETQVRREIVLEGPLFLSGEGPVDLERAFGRRAPVVLDIGAARARYFLNVAPHLAQVDFVGIEIAKKRVEAALAKLAQAGLSNCRMVWGHALEVLRERIAPGSVAAATVLFPDPWPKKRHAKRRIFAQAATADLIARAVAPGGLLLVKTDSASYFDAIAATFAARADFRAAPGLDVALPGLAPFSLDRPEETKYEAEFKDEGRPVYQAAFRRAGA
jgi:tRNA (guanine-N7-)-methyltransferase